MQGTLLARSVASGLDAAARGGRPLWEQLQLEVLSFSQDAATLAAMRTGGKRFLSLALSVAIDMGGGVDGWMELRVSPQAQVGGTFLSICLLEPEAAVYNVLRAKLQQAADAFGKWCAKAGAGGQGGVVGAADGAAMQTALDWYGLGRPVRLHLQHAAPHAIPMVSVERMLAQREDLSLMCSTGADMEVRLVGLLPR